MNTYKLVNILRSGKMRARTMKANSAAEVRAWAAENDLLVFDVYRINEVGAIVGSA